MKMFLCWLILFSIATVWAGEAGGSGCTAAGECIEVAIVEDALGTPGYGGCYQRTTYRVNPDGSLGDVITVEIFCH